MEEQVDGPSVEATCGQIFASCVCFEITTGKTHIHKCGGCRGQWEGELFREVPLVLPNGYEIPSDHIEYMRRSVSRRG